MGEDEEGGEGACVRTMVHDIQAPLKSLIIEGSLSFGVELVP
jgi:hypothetical protein